MTVKYMTINPPKPLANICRQNSYTLCRRTLALAESKYQLLENVNMSEIPAILEWRPISNTPVAFQISEPQRFPWTNRTYIISALAAILIPCAAYACFRYFSMNPTNAPPTPKIPYINYCLNTTGINGSIFSCYCGWPENGKTVDSRPL